MNRLLFLLSRRHRLLAEAGREEETDDVDATWH